MSSDGAADTSSSPGGPTARRILDPGRNCWRIERAGRAAVLVDGASYFAHLERSLNLARRSILIIGWDFDGRVRLRPDAPDEGARPVGELLRALVEARPELEVRILVWSLAVAHGPGAAAPLLFGAAWQEHPRIDLRLDREHPLYAAHHQKLVCIDDAVAFAGGIDITVRRWDSSRHAADEPARVEPDGAAYGPVHDLQMAVDGEAARALAALARSRWRTATGEALDPVDAGADPWPSGLAADFAGTPVAIARTAPAWAGAPAIGEAAMLTLDALVGAKRAIYIEAQYFASFAVGDILAESLARRDGPEIVVVANHSLLGLLERFAMGSNRDRLIRRLTRADRFGRLMIGHPVVPAPGGECEVRIHSKLIVVDDRFVRLGSSNLNNRSVGLDTECDLAIEAEGEATCAAIARLRERLLGEHLGVEPDAVARAVAAEGSLVGAIRSLNTGGRGLRPFEAATTRGPARPLPGSRFLDPSRPFEPLWFLHRRRRRKAGASTGQP